MKPWGDILSADDPFGEKQGGKMPLLQKPDQDETLSDLSENSEEEL
jgi:hypothetical protein